MQGLASDVRIWIDVEDLFEYAAANPRPSGIQRLAFEIYLALERKFGDDGTIRFVRHGSSGNSFVAVPWSTVKALFEGMVVTAPSAPPPPPLPPTASAAPPEPPDFFTSDALIHRWRRRLTHRLPITVRQSLVRFALAQVAAFGAFGGLLREIWHVSLGHRRPMAAPPPPAGADEAVPARAAAPADIAAEVQPGDTLLVLGAPWSHPEYGKLAQKMRRQHGMRLGLLVYDIIPLRRPEWCDRSLVRIFKAWFQAVLPVCDQLFAISHATARDLEAYARETGITIALPIHVLPIGTGFSKPPGREPPGHGDGVEALPPSRGLPAPGSYALIVSTIEARKNHMLLFRVWRRLLEEMPRDQVPTLVFAGRVGWMVSDLMQQLRNTAFLDGKLVLVEDPSDDALAQLYRGSLFTLFPSFYEGWGLPVTESLAFGKPCIISNTTSLPEAGGELARYFDPDNLNDAYSVIRTAIEDRAGLAAWQDRVAREFRPVSWDATADALTAACGLPAPPGAPPEARQPDTVVPLQ